MMQFAKVLHDAFVRVRYHRAMRLRLAIVCLFIAAAVSAAPLTVPPIQYQHRTLANGLQVYSVEDHATPTVAIHVWYHVGSKDDPPGRSGFAHLFEHLMFKSTAHMPSEMMDRLTEDVGGYNNASTADDATWYYEVVPSNYLQTLLWAEGERMGSLTVDDANFKSEREVVKEEFRTSVLGPPYGLFYYSIAKDSFAKHPYRRPTIGSIEDLDAATLEDVKAFHKTYYRPDNATLVVVGDFDPKQLEVWVDRYLGSIPKPDAPTPRVTVKEPPRSETRRITETGPNVPLPALAMTWLAPAAPSAERPALDIAAALLAQGESSRLYQSLIYRQQIAQDVGADADLREDLGLYVITAVTASEKSPAVVQKGIEAELRVLLAKPIPASELDKAKNQLITQQLRRRETNDGKAHAIGYAVTVLHDAGQVNSALAKLQAVTAADVERVMKKYVANGKPVVITYVSKGVAQ
jgi:zinc protease